MNPAQPPTVLVGALSGSVGSIVVPLLRGLGNNSSEAVIASAVPDPAYPLTFGTLALALRWLGYNVAQGPRARARWHQAIDGAVIIVDAAGSISAFVKRAGNVSRIEGDFGMADPVALAPAVMARRMADAQKIIHVRETLDVPLHERNENVRRVFAAALGVSGFINLIALAIPYLTMVVYDRAIGGVAPEILPGLAAGGFLAIGSILLLRRMRAILLASALGRFGFGLQAHIAYRLLRAPLANTGRFQVYGVLSRVREAWRGLDVLSNSLSTALLDAPFMLLTLIALAFVGGLIVIVPVFYLVLFFGAAVLLERRSRLYLQIAGLAAAEREAMLSELAEKAVQLRLSGLGDVWLRRFVEISQRYTASTMRNATHAATTQSVAYVMGTGVAVATLAFGIGLVFSGNMTAGALMAVMLLIWRIVGPAQALFFSYGRIRQTIRGRGRLQALIQAPIEIERAARVRNAPSRVPELRFERASFRYPGAPEQTLTGITFTVEPGEIVAVLGPTGSGKTTVLQIAAGLLTPQLGAVMIDGENLSHIDAHDYRLTLAAYLPIRPHMFDASLKDNIALAAPWIDDSGITTVVRNAWRGPRGDYFAANLDRPVSDAAVAHLSGADAAQLGFARLIAKPPRIAILDSPFAAADPSARRSLEAFLAGCRGSTSVLFSTDEPAMAHLADKVLILNAGLVVYFGRPKPTSIPLQAAGES